MSCLNSTFAKLLAWPLVVALALATLPALAQERVRVLQGTAFWEGDPGPISDSYWVSGLYKYDPNGYMERNPRDSDQFHLMTLFGDHAGKANCVFRRRVVISSWDFQHPHVRVCRTPPGDER
jgi:hypothetical protein